jgi:hypothetical protein
MKEENKEDSPSASRGLYAAGSTGSSSSSSSSNPSALVAALLRLLLPLTGDRKDRRSRSALTTTEGGLDSGSTNII